MKKYQVILPVLLLAACGGTGEAGPKVSRYDPPAPAGMTYSEFRNHEMNAGSDMRDAQKRFLTLDRNNDGVLSPHEFNGY